MNPRFQYTETVDHARRRLAQRAAECGVTVRQDADGRWYAGIVSQPGRWHLVTGYSCDCPGFARHQSCIHHAALPAHLGWLPDDDPPEPDPVAAVLALIPAGSDAEPGEDAEAHPVTTILVDGVAWIQVVGDRETLRVFWLEAGRSPEDFTAGTPGQGDHRVAVLSWVLLLAVTVRGQVTVQHGRASGNAALDAAA